MSVWTPKERAELLHSDFLWKNMNKPVDAAFIFAEQLVNEADPGEAGTPLPPPPVRAPAWAPPRPAPNGGAA